jgi:hypothetical protein
MLCLYLLGLVIFLDRKLFVSLLVYSVRDLLKMITDRSTIEFTAFLTVHSSSPTL